jgi:hypothetical protein
VTDQLRAWVDELAAALGVEAESVDVRIQLDVARDAAHGVARPAAPVTTFLVGLAAGRAGGDAAAINAAASRAQQLLAGRGPAVTDVPGEQPQASNSSPA